MLSQFADVTAVTDASRWLLVRYARLAVRLLANRGARDAAVVGFVGHPLMLLRPLFRCPVLFDIHISLYDTLCLDRQWFRPRSPVGRLALWLDRAASARATHILIDTRTHARYLSDTLGIPASKITPLFVGCDEAVFRPQPAAQAPRPVVTVLHYGSHLPLHGLDTILRAAKHIEGDRTIRFTIVGSGIGTRATRALARELALTNVDWQPFLPPGELVRVIANADICLGGHFSAIPKAARVIAGKTFECLAMGKATIVGENPANHELLSHDHDAYFCPMADPRALADAIDRLAADPARCRSLGDHARATFLARCSTAVQAPLLEQIVTRVAAAA